MLTRVFRKRNATVIVEARGEALFAPGTDLSNWKNRFSHRMTAAVIAETPTHNYGKRPYRPHPGKHLNETITSKTTTRISSGGGRYYIATGSTSPYALYPDQGTGIYAGHSPYEAKLLPPWVSGQPSLYERYKGRAPLIIKGQPAQHYFEKGLTAAFRSMIHRSWQLPGEGVSSMRDALLSFPETLGAAVAANTSADASFTARRAIWRKWRDESYGKKRARIMAGNAAATRKRQDDREQQRKDSGRNPKIGTRGASGDQIRAETARLESWARQHHYTIRNLQVTRQRRYAYEIRNKTTRLWEPKSGKW